MAARRHDDGACLSFGFSGTPIDGAFIMLENVIQIQTFANLPGLQIVPSCSFCLSRERSGGSPFVEVIAFLTRMHSEQYA